MFGQEASCSGATVPQLFPNYFLVFPHLPTFPHIDVYARLATIMVTAFAAATHVTRREYRMRRLVSIVEKRTVVRARELYRSGIHPEALSRALQRGLFLKIGRGLMPVKISSQALSAG